MIYQNTWFVVIGAVGYCQTQRSVVDAWNPKKCHIKAAESIPSSKGMLDAILICSHNELLFSIFIKFVLPYCIAQINASQFLRSEKHTLFRSIY